MLMHRADDGDKKARSPGRSPGRARRKPLKPLRRECRCVRRTCGWITRVLFCFRTRGYRCDRRTGVPCPSFPRSTHRQNSDAIRAARTRTCTDVITRAARAAGAVWRV